jgi:hypothetical protein
MLERYNSNSQCSRSLLHSECPHTTPQVSSTHIWAPSWLLDVHLQTREPLAETYMELREMLKLQFEHFNIS